MDLNKDLFIYLSALCIVVVFLWLWFPYLLMLSIGFASAATIFSKNLPKGRKIFILLKLIFLNKLFF